MADQLPRVQIVATRRLTFRGCSDVRHRAQLDIVAAVAGHGRIPRGAVLPKPGS